MKISKLIGYVIGSALVSLMLIGCRSSLFVSPESGIVPLQKLAGAGNIMLIMDVPKQPELARSLVGKEIASRAKKITVELIPDDRDVFPLQSADTRYNAVLEGDFPSWLFSSAMNVSGRFTKKKDSGITFYRDGSFDVGLLGSNMIGASDTSFPDLKRKMESSDYSFYNDVAVLKLYASDLGLMAMEPTTMFDLGMGITQPMYQKMDFLLLCIHSSAEGAKSVEGEFDMKSQEYADTMLKALKTGYVAMLRKQGEKLDFSALREMFAQDGSVVSFHDMPLSEEQFTQLTDSVASSVKI